jgi:AcrR family transcriptional regulator
MGAMQMREVAARADVSTRTLHVHFPTKNYLLLAALTERGEAADSSPDSRSVRGSDPVQRVVDTLQAQTETLLSMPELAKALVVALSSPDPLVIPLLRRRRQTTVAATVRGLTSGDPTPAELEVALILDQVWFAALVGWATGVEDPDFIMGSLESAARHLLPIRE